jgi:hypothetical protein
MPMVNKASFREAEENDATYYYLSEGASLHMDKKNLFATLWLSYNAII